jgi:hypothetical protein
MANGGSQLTAAWGWMKQALTPSPAAWSAAAAALFAFWAAISIWSGIDAVLKPFSVEKLAGFFIILVAFALATAVLLLTLWLIRLLAPRYRAALLLALAPSLLLFLSAWGPGALIAAPVLLIGLSFFFGAGASLLRARKPVTIVYFGLGTLLLASCVYVLLSPPPEQNPSLAHYRLKGATLALPNPAKPGPYKVATFTYGSGADIRRAEYAHGARFITQAVDGSKLDKQWTSFGGWIRTHYWGFDAAHMPVQGRVWMPRGKGPFPLAFIVHGNHQMENFSDPGYAYLGELFASQGIIFVSADENFLNSSIADLADPFHIRNGDESKARAWMLLQNVAQWRRWSANAKSPLFGKADMDRIVLMGHSRGGEAVAIANAFNNLDRFPDDATLPFDFHFHLRGIAAIAPVDGQYSPRSRPTPMQDQNYFTIQGSMDGDVRSFMGSAQYSRATFSGKADAFKASLYVTGANHGQFNTEWGRNDLGSFINFLLDERPLMDPLAQRQIAKVYLGAFLQMTLNGKEGYRALFEDARKGAAWLPNDYLVNNYADNKTVWLVNCEEDIDPSTATLPAAAVAGPNLTVWRENYVELKSLALNTQLALIAWDDRVHKMGASYQIRFSVPPSVAANTDLVFGASAADLDTLPKGFVAHDKSARAASENEPLDWTVVIADASGQQARLPLSHDQMLYPQIKGETRRAGFLDFGAHSEIVMRRYHFAFADFARTNPKLDLSKIAQIRFDFDRSKRGAIALDDVGLASKP